MNYGYKNEYDFVQLFNEKKYMELDTNSQKFLYELFDSYIDNDEYIKAWKNKKNQKADIFIKYKNRIKTVSLKMGRSNSVHHENIEDFKSFLEKYLPYNIIEYYVSYHYGYKKDSTGKTDYSKVLTAEEYKKIYQKQIDIFNKRINQTKIIIDMIDRFIIKGRNSDYDIDAFVDGTIDDYVWLMKYEIYDLILSKRSMNFTSPHVACMTIGPKKRNIDRKSEYFKERYLVCVRWNFIREEIEYFKKQKI